MMNATFNVMVLELTTQKNKDDDLHSLCWSYMLCNNKKPQQEMQLIVMVSKLVTQKKHEVTSATCHPNFKSCDFFLKPPPQTQHVSSWF
jgi:hypothetical protein